ncbi:MAG TPA: PDZ domain-containing protein [Steroidobacteraceae bacterium]|nr:PDZ domain-containing protein [Steroidobacteraceae bacterium]
MNRNHQTIGAPWYALLAMLFLAVVLPGMAVAAEGSSEAAAEQIARDARRAQEEARRQMAESERTQREALRSQEVSIRRMEESRQRMEDSSREMTRQSEEMARSNSYPYPMPYPVPYSPAGAQPLAPVPPGAPPPQPMMPGAPSPGPFNPAPLPGYSSLGGLELAPVSDRLGDYFGVTAGVLVVRTGPGSPYTLQDGDIILSIDGRAPADAQHAARILRSYQPGERVKLRVQRDRRAIDLDTTAPSGSGN